MIYAQDEDPDSPHHRDQTRLYAAGGTKRVHFTAADIEENTVDLLHWDDIR